VKRYALAVGLDYAARGAASLFVTLPVISAVAATGIGRFPEGDRLLFEPGALMLSEVARLLQPSLSPLLTASFPLLLLFAALLHLPLAGTLGLLALPEPLGPAGFWGRALARVPALLLLSGLTLLGQVLVVILAGALGNQLRDSLANATPWVPDAAFFGALVLGVLVALALGVARDLARAAVAVRACDGKSALVAGLETFRARPLRALGMAALCASGALSLVAAAALATGKLDVSKPEGYRLLLVVLVHQLCLAGVAALRVCWFEAAFALERSSRSQDSAA